jgi:CBS domain-containing protein
VIYYLAWINALLVAFNLLPAFPLDGGRVLRSYLWRRSGNVQHATRTASRIGSAFSDVLIVVGLISVFFGNLIGGIWWFLIGLFLHSASEQSYQQVRIRKALEGEQIRRFMVTDVVSVTPETSVEELVQDYVYKHHHRMFPVVTDSMILGCITTKQVKQVPRDKWHEVFVADLMTACCAENSVNPLDNAVKVLSLMNRTGNSGS